jgi:POT family proton-dependent oligopeptide transporter
LSWAWCFDLDGYLGFYTGLGLVIAEWGYVKLIFQQWWEDCTRKVIFDAIKGFHIGINTGSLSNNGDRFCCCKMGWHAGFGLAGIAMLLGLVVYIWDKIFNPCW